MNEMPVTPPDERVHSFHFHFSAKPHKSIFFIVVALIVGGIIGHYLAKPTQTISVVGAAQLDVKADRATLSGAFETTAKEKNQAVSENQKKIEKLKTILTNQGLSDKNIKNIDTTSQIDDSDGYNGEVPIPLAAGTNMPTPTPACLGNCAGGGPGGGGSVIKVPTIVTYIATTEFEIVLTKNDLKKIDALKDMLEMDLAIQNLDVLYSVVDKTAYDSQLREKALKYGRAQADVLAKTTGLRVKRLVSIHEQKDPYTDGSGDQFESVSSEIPLFASYETSYELGPQWLPF